MSSKPQIKAKRANGLLHALMRQRWFWLVIALALMSAMPAFVGMSWVSLFCEILILAVAASALNLLIGYTGMISFGPAGLYAVGAYTTAVLIVIADMPFGLAMIAGPLVAAVVSLIIGWFCVRRTAVYFALLTLAFSQLIHTIIFKWYGLTGGDDGMVDIVVPGFLSSMDSYYYFALVCTALCLLAMYIIVNSAFGKALLVIRENPGRAEFIGINVRRYQLMAFIMQGFFLGFAGSLQCGFLCNVFPPIANWTKSIEIIISCLLGGMYHFLGPFVGAAVYMLLEKVVMGFTESWSLVLGLVVIFLVLFFRGGIAGFVSDKMQAARREAI
ncbi:MAG: branched-chain amino acid ABC transporter permease [Deltaproteobacteria bacterium]|nr:branched-chain amino acid ABC transporter permease [Deltaproteobacteria bacterium]MBW2343393.1 branched-chain amino acid ABC transporter permease [Deltaproteobacteria bacterium]